MQLVKCRKCPASFVYLRTSKNNYIPVNPESLSDADKHELDSGYTIAFNPKRHISHFVTCLNPDYFRKPKSEPIKSFFEKEEEE
jgi:hypothetical protein